VAQAEADGTLVLLVDDHPINRMVLLKQLNALGFAGVTAEDGLEALEVWASGRFGAIITDCNMPEMNGYDLARRVRDCESRHGHRRTPIIACTANALGGDAEKCFAAGMDDYLAKPIELSALAQKLQHWLALPERRDIAEQPIDGDVLAEISSGDPASAREILERFHRHNAEDTEMLLEAMRRGDIRRVTDASHRIKGASHTIGANALATVCEQMERACKAEDWPAVAAQLDGFRREVRRLNEFIESNVAQQERP
jgi:CheY-like chemotaxis protein/HPt (histidine-containing phosphotransfer) domain-containing protein